MTEFKRYVMQVDAIEVAKPFSKVADLLGGQVLREGNRHVGVILPMQQTELGHRRSVTEGWFVVRNPAGRLTPVRPDIFAEFYRAATSHSAAEGREG